MWQSVLRQSWLCRSTHYPTIQYFKFKFNFLPNSAKTDIQVKVSWTVEFAVQYYAYLCTRVVDFQGYRVCLYEDAFKIFN